MKRTTFLLLPVALLAASCTHTSSPPESKDPHSMEEAAKLESAGDLMGAAKIYGQVARDNPEDVSAEIALANLDRRLGNPADAVTVMLDAKKRQPGNIAVTSNLGYAMIAAGDYHGAVAQFDSLIQQDPNNALAYNGKAVAFDKSGNHLAAQELYKQALSLAPGTLSIQNNLAMSLILNNQLTQAIALLGKLYNDNPDNKVVRHNLALAYGLNGDTAMATKLNLKDLSPEQAKENARYYDYYADLRHELSHSDSGNGMQIGFSETPESDKKLPVKAAAKTANKHSHVARKADKAPLQANTPPAKEVAKKQEAKKTSGTGVASELKEEVAKEAAAKAAVGTPAEITKPEPPEAVKEAVSKAEQQSPEPAKPEPPKIVKEEAAPAESVKPEAAVPTAGEAPAEEKKAEPEAKPEPQSKDEPAATGQPALNPSAGATMDEVLGTQLPTSADAPASGDYPSQHRH